MSAPLTQADLLQRLQAGYDRFQQLIAPLSVIQLAAPGVIGSWSLKDIIAHFIAHEQFALAELLAARRGEAYHSPAASLDAMNAAAVEQYAGQSVEQVLRAWQASFGRIMAAVESLSNAEFAADGMVAHHLNDTIDGALANNTYEHYAEHTPAIEAWLARS